MNGNLLWILIPATLLMACASQTPNQRNRADEALRAQFEEDWKYWMTQYPEVATVGPTIRRLQLRDAKITSERVMNG